MLLERVIDPVEEPIEEQKDIGEIESVGKDLTKIYEDEKTVGEVLVELVDLLLEIEEEHHLLDEEDL